MPRLDGLARTRGDARYGDDNAPADALRVRLVRSPHHHARFTLGDVAAWVSAHPGVLAVQRAEDIPGQACFGVIPGFIDQPVFAESFTRFRGEVIASVIGEADVVEALSLDDFPVQWGALQPVLLPGRRTGQSRGAPCTRGTMAM